MTIKILMLLGKVGEHCFLSAGSLMKRVGATMISSDHNQLRHHHSVVSLKLIFLSSRKSNLGSKKRKSIRISLRIHLSALQKTGLTVNASITGKCVVDSKARTILEVFSFFTNHNFGSGQFLWEGIFNQLADRGALLGTMFSLRTIALKHVSSQHPIKNNTVAGVLISLILLLSLPGKGQVLPVEKKETNQHKSNCRT